MQQIRICARCCESSYQSIRKHIAGASRIFSDHDTRFVVLSVIPTQKTAYLKCVFNRQFFIGFSAKAIRSKALERSLEAPIGQAVYDALKREMEVGHD